MDWLRPLLARVRLESLLFTPPPSVREAELGAEVYGLRNELQASQADAQAFVAGINASNAELRANLAIRRATVSDARAAKVRDKIKSDRRQFRLIVFFVACLFTAFMHSVLRGSSVAVSSTPTPAAQAVTDIGLFTVPDTPIPVVAADSCGNALDTYEAVASWPAVGGFLLTPAFFTPFYSEHAQVPRERNRVFLYGAQS